MIPQTVKDVLVSSLNATINTNGDGEITGAMLNDWLNELLAAIVPTIEESEDQPTVAGDLKIWRDAGNIVKIRDKSQGSNPFVPILVRLAEDVNPALALNILTNVLNFIPGELDLRLLKDFTGIDIEDLPDGGAILWDGDNGKFVVNALGIGLVDTFEGILNAAGTIAIPAKGILKDLIFWTDTDQNLKIGDTVGASDYTDTELTAGIFYSYDGLIFSVTAKTIYLTGENLSPINYKYILK